MLYVLCVCFCKAFAPPNTRDRPRAKPRTKTHKTNKQTQQTIPTNKPNKTKRYLFMKLTYHDATPAAYEPPAFEPAGDAGVGHFKCRPFSM